MKKMFKSFKIKDFLINLLICLSYPAIKTIVSKNRFLTFSDTSFIMSTVFIVGGMVNLLVRSGDFDITSFIAKKSFAKDSNLSYDRYKEDKEKEREGSFNYLLFVGIITLMLSLIASIFA